MYSHSFQKKKMLFLDYSTSIYLFLHTVYLQNRNTREPWLRSLTLSMQYVCALHPVNTELSCVSLRTGHWCGIGIYSSVVAHKDAYLREYPQPHELCVCLSPKPFSMHRSMRCGISGSRVACVSACMMMMWMHTQAHSTQHTCIGLCAVCSSVRVRACWVPAKVMNETPTTTTITTTTRHTAFDSVTRCAEARARSRASSLVHAHACQSICVCTILYIYVYVCLARASRVLLILYSTLYVQLERKSIVLTMP